MQKSGAEELPSGVRRIFYLSSEGTHIEHEVCVCVCARARVRVWGSMQHTYCVALL